MTERDWLKKSVDLLGDSLPVSAEELMKQLEQDSSLHDIAEEDGHTYCLFSVVQEEKELLILLVYSRRGNVIADFSAWHVSADAAVNSHALYDALSEESDWMYLEHYLYHEMVHKDLPYPPADAARKLPQEEVLFTRSAYVSRRYRGRHIFTRMLEMSPWIRMLHAMVKMPGRHRMCIPLTRMNLSERTTCRSWNICASASFAWSIMISVTMKATGQRSGLP